MADVEQVLEAALALGDEGRWQEMAELLAGATRELDEADPFLLGWLGVAERELGNDGAAYDAFKRCLAAEPLDPNLLAMAGAGLAAFDDPDAEGALRAAALTGPDQAFARLQYGAYLAREGMFEEALEHLGAAVRLDPEEPGAQSELAIAHALRGDHAAAAEGMERTLELAPDDSWTRVLLGLVQTQLGDLEAAAEQLVQAALERLEDPEAQLLAALAAASVGWDDAAQDALARAEYAPDPLDAELLGEAEDAVALGSEAARALLLDTVVPPSLHDRLTQPL
ncbi:MAG TPA: tetratricopeptide repeat protein [Longimicrobiales bacterium]|nr:tetratricopeptide repeat protein [Longimicrobiales bacterium]